MPRQPRRSRLRRILSAVLIWTSFAFMIGTIALWIPSHSSFHMIYARWEDWPGPDRWRQRGPGFRLMEGHVFISWSHIEFDLTKPEGIGSVWDAEHAETFRRESPAGFDWVYSHHEIKEPPQLVSGMILKRSPLMGIESHAGFGSKHSETRTPSRLDRWSWWMFPAWLPVVLFAIAPALKMFFIVRRRVRRRRGGCEMCGYDLRGHAPGAACPECGVSQRSGQHHTAVASVEADIIH